MSSRTAKTGSHIQYFKSSSFVEALCHLYPLNKDGYGLTVTESKDFMFSLAENYDIEL